MAAWPSAFLTEGFGLGGLEAATNGQTVFGLEADPHGPDQRRDLLRQAVLCAANSVVHRWSREVDEHAEWNLHALVVTVTAAVARLGSGLFL